jgi:hypothetical protein
MTGQDMFNADMIHGFVLGVVLTVATIAFFACWRDKK